MTYADTARSYERFLYPEVGQEGNTRELRRENAPRTGRAVFEEQEEIARNRDGAEQTQKKRPRKASQES
eukprot:7783126-Heterocapsa_arctica.AAC.1